MEFNEIPWNCSCHRNWLTPSSMECHGIPWNCSCYRNWRTLRSMEFHEIPWNWSCHRNWRTPSSMEFHGIFLFYYLMEPFVSSILWVLNLDRIPWNLSFQILLQIIFNFSGWINFRKSISTLYLFTSLFHPLMVYYQYLHYTLCISGITHYVSKYHSKSLFNAHWNVFWSKSSMELSPEVRGTLWTTFEQYLWFHGIPWNLSNATRPQVPWNSMEFCQDPKFRGIPWNFFHNPEFHGIPWNFGTFNFPEKSSMEFHGIW